MKERTTLSSPYLLSSGHGVRLFDRELSWIAFNRRLTYEVSDTQQPVLDRLLKLALAAASLDEYFMVRMPLLKGMVQGKEAIALAPDALRRVQSHLRALMARQQAHCLFNLMPQLAQQNIHLLNYSHLSDRQKARCQHRFDEEVAPVLSALITPPDDPTPDFSNLSLNLAVWVKGTEHPQLGWVKLPRVLPRFMVLPGDASADRGVVPLEQVIAAHLPMLFPHYELQSCFPFRVTRSTDLGTLDSETANLMEMIQESLQQRQQQGHPVRLEVVRSMPQWMRSHLAAYLKLAPTDVYGLSGWLGLSDLRELTRLPRPDLRSPPIQPAIPAALKSQTAPSMLSFVTLSTEPRENLFTTIAQQDLLLHFPYHSFAETVEQFVAQAALDEQVLTIKMTLYRTAVDAPIVRSLMAAAKAGKQVVVLVELTAPLDEAINIHWAKRLEKAGAHVVYGVVGFRTHTNLVLIARREANHIRQYAYLGTGDYVPDRPQPYEDIGLLTSRADVSTDLNHLFNFLTGCSREITHSTLMVSPGELKTQLQRLIAREADHARQGKPARLIVKLNLLADPDIIDSLYAAAAAGVNIDLIVRSICRLRPQVPGLSDRIRVVSILGQYVEHSRIFYCQNDRQPEVWIGTADWTPRGLSERIEVMVPIQTPNLVADVRQRLDCWLSDNQISWELQANGQYLPTQQIRPAPPHSAHQIFLRWAHSNGAE